MQTDYIYRKSSASKIIRLDIHFQKTTNQFSKKKQMQWVPDSSIYLVSPLTKESVSINNGGGGNCGGDGTIKTIKVRTKEEVFCGVDAEGTLHVKPGLNSLFYKILTLVIILISRLTTKNSNTKALVFKFKNCFDRVLRSNTCQLTCRCLCRPKKSGRV